MSKTRAALTHLWPTLLLLLIFSAVVLFAWYPHPFRQFGNGGMYSALLALAGASFGPALTWLVYKQGKWGLKFDLIFIVLLQLAAVGWGAWSLYQSRPYFMVYTVDRFEVFSKREVDTNQITNPELLQKPIDGPVLLFATMPTDPSAYQQLLREVMFEGKPDLQFRPEFWSTYSSSKQYVRQKSRPLKELRDARPESRPLIDKLVDREGIDIDQLFYTPVLHKDGQLTAVLDGNGNLLQVLTVKPWID